MEFRILGQLQVLDGNRELPLGSAKERALLTVLLLNAGAVVSRERLIDELWGDSPPPTAGKALNVHVSQLRKTLALNGDEPIATRPPGYSLEVEPDRLDAARFERLVEQARERIAVGEVESARASLGEALALWRGPALDGIVLESAGRSEAGRLDELRLAAQMDRIDCDLALGRHEQLIGELEALAAEHPLRERLRSQLMLALYRSGRQADALRTYREARETLVEELGIEPSVPLQRLERAILNHDPALELPEGSSGAGTPPPARRRTRTPWLAVIPVAVLAAALVTLLATRRDAGAHAPPNSVAVIDPKSNEIVGSVAVGVDPGPIAVGPDSVWAANTADETVSRIDARTRRLVRTIPVGEYPSDLTFASGAPWVALGALRQVRRIDPVRNEADVSIATTSPTPGFSPMCTRLGMWIAAEGAALWVACNNRVTPTPNSDALHIDLRTKRVTHDWDALTVAAPVAVGFRDVAYGLGSVWFVNNNANSVAEVDAATLTKLRDVPVGKGPVAAAVGFGSVWVADQDDDTVSRIRLSGPTQGVAVQEIPVGRQPVDVAVGEGAVWVANRGDRTVSRIDPEAGKVVATVELANEPVGLAAGSGAVWVTVQRGEPVP